MTAAIRYFALGFGVFYTLIGTLGFIPALVSLPPVAAPSLTIATGYGYLFGLFPVNLLHNLVHLGIGALGIAAFNDTDKSRLYSQSLAIAFGVLALLGAFPTLNTLFGLVPLFGNDIWLHGLTAIVGAFFGFIAPNLERANIAENRR
ncbi:MAG: DUF4383 domain-containing protein [Chloroflexaceae bacterium]|nr:DUF4383 domain-containing protein [Chloroflexaceae bacterium]